MVLWRFVIPVMIIVIVWRLLISRRRIEFELGVDTSMEEEEVRNGNGDIDFESPHSPPIDLVGYHLKWTDTNAENKIISKSGVITWVLWAREGIEGNYCRVDRGLFGETKGYQEHHFSSIRFNIIEAENVRGFWLVFQVSNAELTPKDTTTEILFTAVSHKFLFAVPKS